MDGLSDASTVYPSDQAFIDVFLQPADLDLKKFVVQNSQEQFYDLETALYRMLFYHEGTYKDQLVWRIEYYTESAIYGSSSSCKVIDDQVHFTVECKKNRRWFGRRRKKQTTFLYDVDSILRSAAALYEQEAASDNLSVELRHEQSPVMDHDEARETSEGVRFSDDPPSVHEEGETQVNDYDVSDDSSTNTMELSITTYKGSINLNPSLSIDESSYSKESTSSKYSSTSRSSHTSETRFKFASQADDSSVASTGASVSSKSATNKSLGTTSQSSRSKSVSRKMRGQKVVKERKSEGRNPADTLQVVDEAKPYDELREDAMNCLADDLTITESRP